MSQTIEISIILTTYKFRAYLRRAVISLLEQVTTRRFEIIVINDASPELDLEVISDLNDPRIIRVHHEHNQGAAESINEGMRLARGALVARFDGDDVWLAHALEQLAQALDQNPQAVVAYGDMQMISAKNELSEPTHIRTAENFIRDEFENLLVDHFTCAPAMLFRKRCWDQVLPWPERFKGGLGDWYFNLRFAQMGPFVYVPCVLAYYRVHTLGMHHQFYLSNTGETNMRTILKELLVQADAKKLGMSSAKVLAIHLSRVMSEYYACGRFSEVRRLVWELMRLDCMRLFRRPLFPFAIGVWLFGRHYNRMKAWWLNSA